MPQYPKWSVAVLLSRTTVMRVETPGRMAEHPKVITAGLRPWASLLCMKASRASEGFQSSRGSCFRPTALRLKYGTR